MAELPQNLDDAIAQAQTATEAAIAAGYTRLQVEILLPELKPLPVAQQFLPVFADLGADLKVFFTDAGAAALAKRDWGPVPFQMASLDVAGARQTSSVEELVDVDDRAFLFVAPSSVEVLVAEQVCTVAGDRPVVLLNPRLEDVGTVGLGYTARQIRDRFLNNFEPCYYLRPLEQAAISRCYPSPWKVWLEGEAGYSLIAEEQQKPNSDRLDQIFMADRGTQQPKRSFIAEMQRFLKALGQ